MIRALKTTPYTLIVWGMWPEQKEQGTITSTICSSDFVILASPWRSDGAASWLSVHNKQPDANSNSCVSGWSQLAPQCDNVTTQKGRGKGLSHINTPCYSGNNGSWRPLRPYWWLQWRSHWRDLIKIRQSCRTCNVLCHMEDKNTSYTVKNRIRVVTVESHLSSRESRKSRLSLGSEKSRFPLRKKKKTISNYFHKVFRVEQHLQPLLLNA